jgi:hypothetical protein
MRKKSTKRTSLKSRSTQISEITAPKKESICLLAASPAQEPVSQEVKQDLTTPNLQCGLNICDASEKDSPSLSLSKTPLDYSIAEWELSSKAYPKAGTMQSGRLSQLRCLEVPKKENDCLSLPTLTTGQGSGRNAGQTRLEKVLKDKGFRADTQALSVEGMSVLFGFPANWAKSICFNPKESPTETTLDDYLGEQSILTAPPSQSNESSISIAALTKVRINKTSLDVASDIAPIFQIQHTVGINIVNPSLLDLVNSLSSDRVRFALELSEKYGGCQKKRKLLAGQLKLRDDWNKYQDYAQIFPSGSKVKIVDHKIDAKLESLLEQRDRLIAQGANPKGVWLSVGQVHGKDFRQVVWKSAHKHPWLNNKKSRYIGKENKEKHLSAIAQHKAGQELRKVEREIKSIQAKKS